VIEDSGPVPVPPRRDARRKLRATTYAFVAVIVVPTFAGGVIGAFVDANSPSTRLAGATWGALIGLGLGWATHLVITVCLKSRKALRKK
jgi:hypothetical protein